MPRLLKSDTVLLDPPGPLQQERNQAAMIEHDQPYGVASGHLGEPAEDDSEEINEQLGRNDDQTWLMPDYIRYPTPPPYMEDATPPQDMDYSGYFDIKRFPDSIAHDPQVVIVPTSIPLQGAPAGWLSNIRGEYIPISSVAKLRLASGSVIACTADGEEVLALYPDDPAAARDAMNIVATLISGAMGITEGSSDITIAGEPAQE